MPSVVSHLAPWLGIQLQLLDGRQCGKSHRPRGAFRSVCGGKPLDFLLRGQNVLGVRDNFCFSVE